MFVRKVRNRSGSISVQVISKQHGTYRVVKTFGSSKDPDEVEQLTSAADAFVHHPDGQPPLFATRSKEDVLVENFIENITNASVHTIGPELIFGTIFDRIGFHTIPEEMFRHLVITRLAYPTSKLKTADYLYRYRGITISVDAIYKFLDKISEKYKEDVERIAYEYTQRTLKQISVVFYDMTTLYFETEDEDDLRKIGFSKDGKFQCPQIMLGLLVGERGFPIGYDIFKGNTFEGHTLLPTLTGIQEKYGFQKPIVVADAGLLSATNIKELKKAGYHFIIGARIKNEAEEVKEEIIKRAEGLKDGDSFTLEKKDGTRLIVTYSEKRRKKDGHNREKGLRKLRERVRTGRLTKQSINNRGYNKFLALEGNVEVTVNETKAKEDAKWDGLKGYVTNTKLCAEKIVQNYGHLWQIEKAFRISKTDLRVRPIFHRRERRIKAHICIAFAAYTVWKEIERLLKEKKIDISPKRAAELAHNMYELEYVLPHSKQKKKRILAMDDEQDVLYGAIHEK